MSRLPHKRAAGNPKHCLAYRSESFRPIIAYQVDTRIRRMYPKGIHLEAPYMDRLRLHTLFAFDNFPRPA